MQLSPIQNQYSRALSVKSKIFLRNLKKNLVNHFFSFFGKIFAQRVTWKNHDAKDTLNTT